MNYIISSHRKQNLIFGGFGGPPVVCALFTKINKIVIIPGGNSGSCAVLGKNRSSEKRFPDGLIDPLGFWGVLVSGVNWSPLGLFLCFFVETLRNSRI